MKNYQYTFWSHSNSHGGETNLGHEKKARPIATKRPIHLIFRSSRAKGEWGFLHPKNCGRLKNLLEAVARRFGVKIYSSANVGNHLHLLVQAKRRENIQNFLRVFPQAVAFLVTGTKKGKAIGKFWDYLAFSRVVEWGRDWRGMLNYVEKNVMEASGVPRDLVDFWYAEAEPAG